jgi:F420-non-reducing hydrogenase large subunit
MTHTITIDPVTRIEGHARVEIDVDDDRQVTGSVFKVLDFRGWETFLLGTKVEMMPAVTARICGTCSVSHHLTSVKAVDRVFGVEPPRAAVLLRYAMNLAGYIHSHGIHIFALAAPDLLLEPGTAPAKRNIIGLLENARTEAIAKMALDLRRISSDITEEIGGRGLHPVTAVEGGMARPLSREQQERLQKRAAKGLELAKTLYEQVSAALEPCQDLLESLPLPTYYLGLVNQGALDHYQGVLRLCGPEAATPPFDFPDQHWADYLVEETEPTSYAKTVWCRHHDREKTAYRVGPLARLNCCEYIDTPLANEALQKFRSLFGLPCHQTVLYHYTRLIELLYAAEKLVDLLNDPEICSAQVRTAPAGITGAGVGVVEAPRGVLIHDYKTDENGILTGVNLMVATQQNLLAINRTVGMAAQRHLLDEADDDTLMNGIEFGIRCYDPCLSCATHRIGELKMEVVIRNNGQTVRTARRI